MSVRCHAVHVPHGSDPATRPECDVTDPSAPGLARCARVAFMAAAATGLSGCLAVVPIVEGGIAPDYDRVVELPAPDDRHDGQATAYPGGGSRHKRDACEASQTGCRGISHIALRPRRGV